MAQACQFSSAAQMFSGSAAAQASCLLRKVRIGGNIDTGPAPLPDKLQSLVGQPPTFTKAQLGQYLARKGISAATIGGDLGGAVSQTLAGNPATYFVIHDTSDELVGSAFPTTINTAAWPSNDLASRPVNSAHVFINRLGESRTGHDYSVGWRATKFEREPSLKGLFLHHELVQPRIKGGFGYHAVAPQPGFTQATYDRLALCYLAASVRRGQFLIPAFHCVLDTGIDDGHDDPQNFELFQWSGAIERILGDVLNPIAVDTLALSTLVAAPVVIAPNPALPASETVRTDLRDGERSIVVKRVTGSLPLFFKAKIAIDADGSARAYHPDAGNPDALDDIGNANSYSKKYIQGQSRNNHVGKGPRDGFYVSATSLQRGDDWDADAYVDAEFVPYIVLPDDFAPGVRLGDLCTVVNLKNNRYCSAIFADTNPDVGEASIRVALNLHLHDPSFPITKLARAGGDRKANYVYIVYPGSRFTPRAQAPHWPVDKIEDIAGPLFEAWGGLAMVDRLFPTLV